VRIVTFHSRAFRQWVNFAYERNKNLPAQKTGGRYKSDPHNRDMVL
jgi:hypothetical protein